MPSSSSPPKTLKVRPSEVAADTKRKLIPEVIHNFPSRWPTTSFLYAHPLAELPLQQGPHIRSEFPQFYIRPGDPVNLAITWAESQNIPVPIPFICSANEKRPGGDWETGVVGYEERLCRRSNLSATLSSPDPRGLYDTNYPIPVEGAIYSPHVVRFREHQDRIESLDVKDWKSLPVISIPPTRWPKLTEQGRKYSFAAERQIVQNKMRAALRVCAFQGFQYVVIGDFGLGNGYRNPPRELAELWRDILLWDIDLRGQFLAVMFVFEDDRQSTAKFILEDIAKKNKTSSSHYSSSKGRSKSGSSSTSSSSSSGSSSSSSSSSGQKSDYKIFCEVFDDAEVARIRKQRDPRYGFATIMGA